MVINKWFTATIPIPDGYQIYEERIEVVGIAHYKAAATAFVKGKAQYADLVPEPNNPQDGAAIKVIGCCKGLFGDKSRHIGYLPGETAARLHDRGFTNRVRGRLLHVYLSDKGFVEVLVQVLGPVGEIEAYAGRKKRVKAAPAQSD